MGSADTPNGDAPQAQPRYLGLKIVVYGLGALIILMTILLFVGMGLGWGKRAKPEASGPVGPLPATASEAPAGTLVPLEIETPRESRLYTLAGDGSRIALHIAAPTGDEIIVIDTVANRVISRIRLKPEGGPTPSP